MSDAWLGRGNVYFDIERYDDALTAYEHAIMLNPDLAEAWLGRGNVYLELYRYDQAFHAYDKAFALKPELSGVEGFRLHCKMHLCDWSNFDAECARLVKSVRDGLANSAPFAFLGVPSSPADQLQCAKLWITNNHPRSEMSVWQGRRCEHDRIRVAYLSADFRNHAVAYLICGVLEKHDKSRFETIGLSLGPQDNSEMSERIKNSFDTFIDIRNQTDADIANLIYDNQVDIAIDLMGLTQRVLQPIPSIPRPDRVP
jgi:protein O-GlcNAc transferase